MAKFENATIQKNTVTYLIATPSKVKLLKYYPSVKQYPCIVRKCSLKLFSQSVVETLATLWRFTLDISQNNNIYVNTCSIKSLKIIYLTSLSLFVLSHLQVEIYLRLHRKQWFISRLHYYEVRTEQIASTYSSTTLVVRWKCCGSLVLTDGFAEFHLIKLHVLR